MKLASSFSKPFIEGFVQRCIEIGLDANGTEELFQKYANNQLMASPNVYEGFRERLNRGDVPLSKAAMAKYLNPDVISLAVDCHIKYAHDPMSILIREQLGLPEPAWDNVPEGIQKIASQISGLMHSFGDMPLQQKVLLASLIGGGLGGAKRLVAPNVEDEYQHRGALNRFGRGLLRGGAIGAGAGLGAGLGQQVAGRSNRLAGLGVGGMLGGIGTAAMT